MTPVSKDSFSEAKTQLSDDLSTFKVVIDTGKLLIPSTSSANLDSTSIKHLEKLSSQIANAVKFICRSNGGHDTNFPLSDEEILDFIENSKKRDYVFKKKQPILSLSLEDKVVYTICLKKLFDEILPSQLANLQRFIETKGSKLFYSFNDIYLYMSVADKVFEQLTNKNQFLFLALASMHQKTFSRIDVEVIQGSQKALYNAMNSIFSRHISKQRSLILKVLEDLESLLMPIDTKIRREYSPWNICGREIYYNIYQGHKNNYTTICCHLRDNLFLSEDDLQRCLRTTQQITEASTASIDTVHAFVSGEKNLDFSMENLYTLFSFACDRFDYLPLKSQECLSLIIKKIHSTEIKKMIKNISPTSKDLQGFYLCIVERLEMLNNPNYSTPFSSYLFLFEDTCANVDEDASIGGGWKGMKSLTPPPEKMNPSQIITAALSDDDNDNDSESSSEPDDFFDDIVMIRNG